MAKDWEKLAGEQGKDIPTGRFQRLLELGKMGARVTASSLVNKASSMLPVGDKNSRDQAFERAQMQNAKRMVEVLGRLKGASMKIGQLLSADPELIPDEFADVLSSLQSDAPPMTYLTIKEQIETAYDLPIEVVFQTFDPEPVGSASIGQVHRATLDTGQEVAVKIQYPGVVDALESDLKSLGSMMVYGRAMIEKQRLDAYLDEIKRTILKESDYVAEGHTLNRFREILAEREGVRAPKAFLEWTRPNILVMEYVHGTKLDDALHAMEPGDERDALITRWVGTYSWMFHELFEMHADPHPGNFLMEEDGTLVMLDFGNVTTFTPEFADGILDILDTCWQGQPERALAIYKNMGFGQNKLDEARITPNLLADYHDIMLAPFLKNESFAFGTWEPAKKGKMFMLRNPEMLNLMPPAEALPYFRMLSGVKGLLAKLDAHINVCAMSIETARRRDRLTDEPLMV